MWDVLARVTLPQAELDSLPTVVVRAALEAILQQPHVSVEITAAATTAIAAVLACVRLSAFASAVEPCLLHANKNMCIAAAGMW